MTFAKCDGDTWDTPGAGKIDGMCPTSRGEVPCQFAGLWWMDGNPAADFVASFGGSSWRDPSSDKANCLKTQNFDGDSVCACSKEYLTPTFDGSIKVSCLGRLTIAFRDPHMWSFENSLAGKALQSLGVVNNAIYIFECGGKS